MQSQISTSCIVRISVLLGLMIVIAFSLLDVLEKAFFYNVQINSVILASFLTGVIFVYHRLFLIEKEYRALRNFDKLTKPEIQKLKLIRPITLHISKGNKLLSSSKLQTILGSIEKRIEDSSSFPKYVSGLLIFLGLFGTFWGLSHTIGNVANIIDNLGIEQADAASSFLKLKDSLKIPLAGMGIAFGCSLFGLSTSLIIGFLNINQKKVADRFLDAVEEWLSINTVSFDAAENYQEYHGEVFSMALLEKTIEMIYVFQKQLKDVDYSKVSVISMQRDISQKLSLIIETIASKKENESIFYEMLKKLDALEKLSTNLLQSSFANSEQIVDSLGKDIRMISKTLSLMTRDK
ncbi:MAG: hypothetical protein LBM19_00115 [Holosporales bacterium]|jgi:predicted transporter|nr:hypothetical protein [Holosporales bacterium]